MGMFDTVWCDWPLPAPEAQGYQFQTKDLNCGLDEYRITAAQGYVAVPGVPDFGRSGL